MTKSEVVVAISSEAGASLEGRATGSLDEAKNRAIISHPHPLRGGAMDNNVILAARDAAWDVGYDTVRFNFRGVGQSSGQASADIEPAAADVVAAAHAYRAERHHLMGYSFGAFAALGALSKDFEPASVVLISPPLSVMSMGEVTLPSCPLFIILGREDEHCVPAHLYEWLKGCDPQGRATVRVFDQCDHFFVGREVELRGAIYGFLAANLSRAS